MESTTSSTRCSARRGVVRSTAVTRTPETDSSPSETTGMETGAATDAGAGAGTATGAASERGVTRRKRSMPSASRVILTSTPSTAIFAMAALSATESAEMPVTARRLSAKASASTPGAPNRMSRRMKAPSARVSAGAAPLSSKEYLPEKSTKAERSSPATSWW